MPKDLDISPAQEQKTFEISLIVYDSKGNPTSKRKTYSSDYASGISNFWYKNRGGTHHKKSKNDTHKSGATTADDAKKILDGLYNPNDKNESKDKHDWNK